MRPVVLVAESNELMAAAYRTFLVAEGFSVLLVDNGPDCLAQIRTRAPQALIVDAEILSGSSEDILELLAQGSDLPHIPAVLLTVGPHALSRRYLGIAPVTLIKPVSPAAIARMLHEVLAVDSMAVLAPDHR